MHGLLDDQKLVIKNLYKLGRKLIKLKSHVYYLTKCLETGLIPKSFKISKEIPGNLKLNQQKLDKVSLEAVGDEKERQLNIRNSIGREFEKEKKKLKQVFGSNAEFELKRWEEGKFVGKIN